MSDWPAAPLPLPGLAPDEVHVWAVQLDRTPREVARLHALLSAEEGARADGFRGALHRERFIVAHGALRLLLGHYLGAEPCAIELASGPAGKPQLAGGNAALRFNLSHAGGAAVMACALLREVGVDIGDEAGPETPDEVARSYFPTQEQDRLRALPAGERAAAFRGSWAAREAYAKATGAGIAGIDLRALLFSAPPGLPPRLEGLTDAAQAALRGWTLTSLPPFRGAPVMLVCAGDAVRVHCWAWRG